MGTKERLAKMKRDEKLQYKLDSSLYFQILPGGRDNGQIGWQL